MAEFGAHVSSKVDVSRASIFELLAQDNLSAGLRNAFQYLTNVITEANPDRYAYMRKWCDEMYLMLDIVVQYSHLRTFKASFSEYFYGLKRIDASGKRMTPRQLWSSFMIICLFPYIRRKLDRLMHELEQESSSENRDICSTPGHNYLKLYPLICFLVETSNLLLHISYALEKSDYHCIWNQLIGVHLVVKRPDEEAKSGDRINDALQWNSWLLAKYVAKTIGSCLYAGAFFIQFLEYFYAREGNPSGSLIRSPKPAPPVTSLYARVKVNRLRDFCLLCNEKRENDTVLSTSGYIFCYSCIRAFVVRNKKCPATGIPSSTDHLIRLYPMQE